MIWAGACSSTNFPTLKMPKNANKVKCDGPNDRPTNTMTYRSRARDKNWISGFSRKTRPDTRHKMRLVCLLFTFENNTGPTDGPTDGRTRPHIEMRRRIKKGLIMTHLFSNSANRTITMKCWEKAGMIWNVMGYETQWMRPFHWSNRWA